MRIAIAAVLLVEALVQAGTPQESSTPGRQQPAPSHDWNPRVVVGERLHSQLGKEIRIFRQRHDGKVGSSLTITGPSHLVQTVHRVRTIDQGGKIISKSVGVHAVPVVHAPVGNSQTGAEAPHNEFSTPHPQANAVATPALKQPLVPQLYRVAFVPEIHKYAVVVQVPKRLVTQAQKRELILQAQKNLVMPEFEKHAVIRQMRDYARIPQMHSYGLMPQVQNSVLIPQVQRHVEVPQMQNHVVIPQSQNDVMIPQTQNHIVIPQIDKRVPLSRVQNDFVVHQIQEHVLAPHLHGYASTPQHAIGGWIPRSSAVHF